MLLCPIPKIQHILSEREKVKHYHYLVENLEIPYIRD